MTFEEYMVKTYGEFWNKGMFQDDGKVIRVTEHAWNAAKEDSKPVAKIVERKLYGMNEVEYSIIGFGGFESAIRSTREQAQQWAIENGYRIAEDG